MHHGAKFPVSISWRILRARATSAPFQNKEITAADHKRGYYVFEVTTPLKKRMPLTTIQMNLQ